MEPRTPPAVIDEAIRERNAERRWRVAVLASAAIGCSLPLGFVSAQSITQRLISTIFLVLGNILEVIINFIGKLIILLVDVIIAVAQYNHFVDAAPVKAGWPLVRDVTNMFVIVILLAIAFGTIIGYQKLHYKGVLGKLLLMAVLVNFSKQLIGLLIDFSQVVMLTFVNAFRAAAGGNFTQALKLDKMLSLQTSTLAPGASTEPSTVGDPLLVKMIVAEMLAVFFLGIAVVLLLIMFVYLIVRIVGLWIALVLSPLALFMTAVPPVIAGKVNSIADGYWTKLSSLVAGGPVMAFFIWLTLATVQGGGFGTFNTANLAGANEAAAAVVSSGFSNAIGNIEDVATFFIAVVMLMMGVDTAIGMSGTLGPKITGIMGKIKTVGTQGAKYAAYGVPALAGLAVAKGGGVVARKTDRVFDLTGKLGRGMQRAGLALGAPTLAAEGAKLAGRRTEERKKRGEVITKSMVGLSAADKLAQYERIATRTVMDPAGARAAELALAKSAVTFEGGMELGKRFEAEADSKGLTGTAKDAYRDQKSNDYIREHLATLEDTARREGNEDDLKFVADKRKDNMAWYRPDMDIADTAQKMAEKTAEVDITKTFTAASFANAGVADGVIKGTDILNADGTENEKSVWYKKLLEPNGMASKAIRARVAALAAVAGGAAGVTALLNNPDRLKQEGLDGGRIVRTKAGQYEYVKPGVYTGVGETAPQGPGRGRVESEIRAGRDVIATRRAELEETRRLNVGGIDMVGVMAADSALAQARVDTLQAGADMNEVYRMEPDGTFADKEAREEFERDIAHIQSAARPDFETYGAVDGVALTQNTNVHSDTRATFVENVDVKKLGLAARDAQRYAELAKDHAPTQNISHLARAIDIEGSQAERKIDSAMKGQKGLEGKMERTTLMSTIKDVAKAHESARANMDEAGQKKAVESLKKALTGAGVKEDAVSIQDAEAILKREQMKGDTALRNYAQSASGRMKGALDRAGVAVQGAAADVKGLKTEVEESLSPTGRKMGRARSAARAYEGGDTNVQVEERTLERNPESGTVRATRENVTRSAESLIEPPRPGQQPPSRRGPRRGGNGNTGQT